MSDARIIVTRRWPKVVEDELCKISDSVVLSRNNIPMTQRELVAAMQGAECVLPTVTDDINEKVLLCDGAKCKFLGNFGVGFNHINLDAAKKAGIAVSNTPEVLTECTADIAMVLLLMAARRTGEGERLVRASRWEGWCPTHMVGHKVSGKTLGLVGFGRIARAVANRAHFGFGMKISFYTPEYVPSTLIDQYAATEYESLGEMLGDVDFVSIHCPGGRATYHMFDKATIGRMQSHAILVNSARGDVIDNEALIEALASRRIAAAGLDVYENEPSLNPGFLDLENVVLLPHLGSATTETRISMGRRVLDNLRAYLSRQSLLDRVV